MASTMKIEEATVDKSPLLDTYYQDPSRTVEKRKHPHVYHLRKDGSLWHNKMHPKGKDAPAEVWVKMAVGDGKSDGVEAVRGWLQNGALVPLIGEVEEERPLVLEANEF
jgi:hypothetical protein